MKKILKTTAILLWLFSIIAASGCTQSDVNKGVDKQFIKAVKVGLDKRWAITDKLDDTSSSKELIQAVKNEENAIKDFKSEDFDSPELGKLCKDYQDILKKQLSNLPYDSDFYKLKNYDETQAVRYQILLTLVDKFGLQINKDIYNEFKQYNDTIENNTKVVQSIKDELLKAKFEIVPDTGSYQYQGIIQNKTGYDIEGLEITFKLIGNDGTTLSAEKYYHNGTWSKDEKIKVDFWRSNLDGEIKKMDFEVEIQNYK